MCPSVSGETLRDADAAGGVGGGAARDVAEIADGIEKEVAMRGPLILVVLLASVATASAECAWVAWQSGTIGASTQVTTLPVGGYTTQQACVNWIASYLNKAEASRSESAFVMVDRDHNAVVTMLKTKSGKMESVSSLEFVCLPDTVDPRAPRTK
jgi:hypothetical protein